MKQIGKTDKDDNATVTTHDITHYVDIDEEHAKEMKKKIPQRNETSVNEKDNINWLAYSLFIRSEFDECLNLVNLHGKDDKFESQFSMYIKALVKRSRGEVNESLEILRKLYNFNENNLQSMKEIGKSLSLLGKYKMAIDIYNEVLLRNEKDWDTNYQRGLCYMNLGNYEEATKSFEISMKIFPNEQAVIQLGKISILQQNFEDALEKYKNVLELVPENTEVITAIGSIYLKLYNTNSALEYFTKAMKYDVSFTNALLGAASIYQDKGDYDSASAKYKLASISNPNSPLVWNNLGLCFCSKQKYIAAITCMKKAIYLDPFEWIVNFNLGLVYCYTKQYVSAFHYMNCALNLKSDIAIIYMYLGVILTKLGDISTATLYYDKSLELEQSYITLINYTISLINNDMIVNAKQKFNEFQKLFTQNKQNLNEYDDEIKDAIKMIKSTLA